jgi:hypothetical protein
MRRGTRILLWSLAVLVLVGGGTWAAVAIHRRLVYGAIFDESALRPTVEHGKRFTLAVADQGASVGDEWSPTVTPDGTLTLLDNRQVMSNPVERIFGAAAGGGAGTRYFTYAADRPGTVTVLLYNCFQGLCKSGRIDPWSRGVTWTITVS